MKLKDYSESVEFPEAVTVMIDKGVFTVKGPEGELTRDFRNPKVQIAVVDREVKFSAAVFTKREKTQIGTFMAHTKNMVKGVTEGHVYTLKICSGHFPMNVTFTNNQLVVKNFLGEKVPRVLPVAPGAKVAIEGDHITVRGINKELVAQVAASMELLTRRTKFDKRRFQDGIYIVNKDGKEIK